MSHWMETQEERGESTASGAMRRVIDFLLRIPLLAKVLIANAAAIGGAVLLALWIVTSDPGFQMDSAARFLALAAGLALALGAVVNAVIVRVAFRPLRTLGEAVERVSAGKLDTRVALPRTADRRLRQLAHLFNCMLERLSDEHERRRRLAAGALQAEHRIRGELSAALYDETAQRMAAHIVRLKRIENEAESEQIRSLVEQMRAEATDTLETVRQTARSLHPPEVAELGIGPALQAYARHSFPNAAPDVSIRSRGIPDDLPLEFRVSVYRIFQEALSNALCHADASRVEVEIRREGSRIVGQVVDDGRGLDPGPAGHESGGGLGLTIIRVLAAELEGEVAIGGQAGSGSRVRLSVPIPDAGASRTDSSPDAGMKAASGE